MKLTDSERLILTNQFRILSLTDHKEKDFWAECQEIVEQGYEALYHDLPEISAALPRDECKFVFAVLDTYRILDAYKSKHPNDVVVQNHAWANFSGFDGNDDRESRFMRFTSFLIVKQGKWMELKSGQAASDGFNSHMRIADRYKKMVDARANLGDPVDLTHEQAMAILNAAL